MAAAPARAPLRRPAPARRPSRGPSTPRRRAAARPASRRGAAVLDALLHGRAWLAIVFVLLVGIVFFNVDLLRMNRDIARTADRAAVVKRENARLRTDLARLGSSERIQRVAAQAGLVLPAPGEVRYLRSRPGIDARRAAQRIAAGDVSGPPVPAKVPPTQQEQPLAQAPDPAAQAPGPTTQTPAPTAQTQAPAAQAPQAPAATNQGAAAAPGAPQAVVPRAGTPAG